MRLLRTSLMGLSVLIGSARLASAALAQGPPAGAGAQTIPAPDQTLTSAAERIEVSAPDGATSGTETGFDDAGSKLQRAGLATGPERDLVDA